MTYINDTRLLPFRKEDSPETRFLQNMDMINQWNNDNDAREMHNRDDNEIEMELS